MEKLKYEYEDSYIRVATNYYLLHQEYIKQSRMHNIYTKRILPMEANLIRDILSTSTENKKTGFDMNNLIFSIYNALYYNGYLSVSNSFKIEDDTEEIPMDMGTSINIGKGVCKNIAIHYTELLNILCPKQINLVVQTKINSDKSQAHLETLVMNKSGLFLYDPTNFKIKKLTNIGKSNTSDHFNLWFNLFRGDFLNSEEKRLEFFNESKKIRYILENSDRISVNNKYLNGLEKYGTDLCVINYDKIEEFQKEINPTYKYLNKSKKNFYKVLERIKKIDS